MEKPNDLTPEAINERLKAYDEEFSVSFEKGVAVSDISGVVQQWADLVDPLVDMFGSRSEVARADKAFVNQMMAPRLRDAIQYNADDLKLAHVRIDGDMLALQEVQKHNSTTLNYFTSDESTAIEGIVRGVYCAAIPSRDDLRKIIDTAPHHAPRMKPVHPELYVCITLEDTRIIERDSREALSQLGEVIIPLYPDAISVYRIDTLRS